MKLRNIYLIILYQIVELLIKIRCDHVQVIGCSDDPKCLQNLNKRLLEIIQENLQNGTQPCEHFWNFACGSWTSAPYHDHVDNFGAMENYYADNLIETLYDLKNDVLNIQELLDQIVKYFESCKTTKNFHLNMSLYLKEIPGQKIFGEEFKWNYIFGEDESNWQDFSWLKAAAHLRKYGFKELFVQETAVFAGNNSLEYVLQLKIPHPKVNFQNKYKVLQIMPEFNLIFPDRNTKNYLKLAGEIFKFDGELQNLSKKYELLKQEYYISVEDLTFLLNDTDWSLYFDLLLNQTPVSRTTVEFLGNFKYFEELDGLLKQTPKSIQGIYTLIRFCQYLMQIRPVISDRECLLHTNVMFTVGVNYIYSRFLYKNRVNDQETLQTLFALLKREFSKIIQTNKFALTIKELEYLLEKINRMQLKIGNLPLVLHDINHYYSTVQLKKSNFYYNHLEMLKFRTMQQHKCLLDPVNLNTLYVNDDISQLRNAPYFIHQRNLLIVPMTFLQLPLYHHAQHPVFQFSVVGWIMAHELSHAFDTHGLKFDAWGNENLLGTQLARKTSYLSAVECLVKYCPAVSLNERLADVNGLQLAFQTFFHVKPKNISNEFYEDDDMKKLFFINFAQFFCGSLPRAIGHDRDDVRVRHSVANMREFSEVFRCSTLAKENPSEKCNIWRK